MSAPESWEDEQDTQEDLSRRTQQMNFGQPQGGVFQPGAQSFQPGAQSFQPQQFQQYGGGYGQQNYGGYQQQQYGQQNYNQYGGGYGQQGYGMYGAQNGYNGYQQAQAYQPPQQRFQQQQPQQAPVIAKRPQPGDASTPATSKPVSAAGAAGKTLSIGGDGGAKVETTGGVKSLSIGSTAPAPATKVESTGGVKTLSIGGTAAPSAKPAAPAAAKATPDTTEPEAGAKTVAAKAVEKTGDASATAGGKSSPTSSGRNSPTPQDKRAAAREADAVAKEQEADVDDETLQSMYGKEHVNVIFLGHVDAGKSTLGGSILYATGMVDERTMEKYKKEAKDAGRETWYLSWALDLTKEERSKGKTVEVGRGFFETEKRRYSILDAPGHKNYVPHMISGASQADVGCLVISARKGEYETGFEKGGQTREHAMLAKTSGVNKLIIAVNKMDDPTVEWSQDRYNECTKKLSIFLKGIGYNPKTDLEFMPISAQTTVGIKNRVSKELAPWHDGPSLLEYLDGMQALERKIAAPFMMPVAAKYREMGTMIEGKIESGVMKKGVKYMMMPTRVTTGISALYGETEDEIDAAACGDQIRCKLRDIEEEDILPGFVLCSTKRPVHCVSAFEAQIQILDLKSIMTAGYNCVIHVHSATEEITISDLLHTLQKGTGRRSKKKPTHALKGQGIIARLEVTGAAGSICVERFEDYPQLGRFTLRDQGQTIAIGKITKLITDEEAAAGA